MNLWQFQQLSGITVPEAQQAIVQAQILRTKKLLESMLGFTLDPEKINENFYNEEGKTATECSCPNVSTENLLDPDELVTAYRLFPYNPHDKYFHIDPFTQVHQVKLVWNNVTVKTFDEEEYRANFANGWGKYLENCQGHRLCVCACTDCVQLAVDADWMFVCDSSVGDSSVGCIYDEILYIWADMISFYADCKKDVKSESIGSHSYTKYDKIAIEDMPSNIAILKKYAGPNGTLSKLNGTIQ